MMMISLQREGDSPLAVMRTDKPSGRGPGGACVCWAGLRFAGRHCINNANDRLEMAEGDEPVTALVSEEA